MTVDEIIAKMRKDAAEDESTPDGILGQTLNYLADELEKAINEERARHGSALFEAYSQPAKRKPKPVFVKAKRDTSREDFLSALNDLTEKADAEEMSSIADALSEDLKNSGVEFDTENCTCDPKEHFDMPGFFVGLDALPGGTPIMWFSAGGDWESPLAFFIYLGIDNKIHAYVPREGNCFNKEKGAAFGNSFGMNAQEEMKSLGVEYRFDMCKMREDASNALEVQ